MDLQKRLVEKSVEAFIMGLELYNKPTIKYRIEGFSFFVCNAWELMLKAKMLKDGKSIYYKNKFDRTLDLSKVVQSIYTNKKQPLRINLEKVIDLRNTSTHFVTDDYETIYAPLFQATVINFTNEMKRFHEVDITNYIAQNFLTLSATMNALTGQEIKLKYDPETAERLILHKNDIEITEATLGASEKFTIPVEHHLVLSKSKKQADFSISIDKESKNKGSIIKEYKDPADTHKYSYTNLLDAISNKLEKNNIGLEYLNKAGVTKTQFTPHILNLFIDFYDIKNRKEYAYKHIIGKSESFTYSQQAVEFVVEEIRKEPKEIVKKLRSVEEKGKR